MYAREILRSWKETSTYLGRDIRTCRRREENLGTRPSGISSWLSKEASTTSTINSMISPD